MTVPEFTPELGRTRELPPWADRWLDGSCGCGSPLVEVTDMTGASRTVCKISGWDNMVHERPCARESADREVPAMTKQTVRVTLSDACTDVLVYLANRPSEVAGTTWHAVRDAVAPPDADDASATTLSAIQTLRDGGLVELVSADGFQFVRATPSGRQAVRDATPQSAEDGGDHG